MGNVIFQYYLNFNGVGKQGMHYPTEGIPKWVFISSIKFREYAEKHNATHVMGLDRYVKSTSNFFEVTRLFRDPYFDQFDNLLYVDCDVIPKNMGANIFDVPFGDVMGWPEWRHPELAVKVNWNNESAVRQRFADFGAPLVKPKSIDAPYRMINSGVMLWSKEARLKARDRFIDHEKWFHHKNALLDPKWKGSGHSSHCLDQPYFNAMWNKFDFDVTECGPEWNRFPMKNENFPCNFAHYVGDYRYDIEKMYD